MPNFESGSTHRANIKVKVTPSGLSCEALLSLISSTKQIAKSVVSPFQSGADFVDVSLSVGMPVTTGDYTVYLDILSGNEIIGSYAATEQVRISVATSPATALLAQFDQMVAQYNILDGYYREISALPYSGVRPGGILPDGRYAYELLSPGAKAAFLEYGCYFDSSEAEWRLAGLGTAINQLALQLNNLAYQLYLMGISKSRLYPWASSFA